jgi:cysteine desulfurase
MRPIYLDHNATTPLSPEVAEAMRQCYAAGYANPASLHQPGRRARRVLDEARGTIGHLLGADVQSAHGDRLIFTSGGTEANNLAILGLVDTTLVDASSGNQPGHIIISAIEHPSVIGAAEHLARLGWRVDRVGVTSDGVIDLEQFDALLRPETRLVSIMMANNETGAIQPIAEIVRRCSGAKTIVHTDAVQMVGKLPVDFRSLGVDSMTVTAHKLHGPVGIGALVVRPNVALRPLLHGGVQQESLRPGTESVALAVGFCTALEIACRDRDEAARRMTSLRDRFEERLRDSGHPVVVNAAGVARLPHTSNVAFPGTNRQAMMMALDLAGVACSTGSACASGSTDPSPTLVAMGLAADVIDGSLRFSFGRDSTIADVDEAVERIVHCLKGFGIEKMRGNVPAEGRIRTADSV